MTAQKLRAEGLWHLSLVRTLPGRVSANNSFLFTTQKGLTGAPCRWAGAQPVANSPAEAEAVGRILTSCLLPNPYWASPKTLSHLVNSQNHAGHEDLDTPTSASDRKGNPDLI